MEGMREIWVCRILEEDAGFWERMRETWVFRILKGGMGIDPGASRKKLFIDAVPVADLIIWHFLMDVVLEV